VLSARRKRQQQKQRLTRIYTDVADLRGAGRLGYDARQMAKQNLKHSELTERLIQIYFEISNELGYGFLESIYEKAFVLLLAERSIPFQQQYPLDVIFRGTPLGEFRADLIVDLKVIIELKATQNIEVAHEKQLLNYLRAPVWKSDCYSISVRKRSSADWSSRISARHG
jgi:GxxExxY protein